MNSSLDTTSDDEASPSLQPTAAPSQLNVARSPQQRVEDDVKSYCSHRWEKTCRKCPNAIQFWLAKSDICPELSSMALEYLTIPATSCSVERMFSVSGVVSGGPKSRSASDSIESKTVLAVNASEFPIKFD